MEAERQFGTVEGRDPAIDRVLPRKQVVVDRRFGLLEFAVEQVLHAGARTGGEVQHVLHLLPRERLLEFGDDVGLLGAEGGGQLIVDFLRRPLVLAAVTARERALHLAEDRAGHERNAVGPVAELTHHILVVGNDLPVERGPPDFRRRGSQGGDAGGNERRVRHRLQLVDLIAGEIQVLERVGRDRLLRLDARGDVGRAIGIVAAALRRDLVEQPLGGRHVHHADDLAAATGLAEDHHVRWDRRRRPSMFSCTHCSAITRSAVPV